MYEKPVIGDINKILLPYMNRSYKDDIAGYHKELFGIYSNVLSKFKGRTTTAIADISKYHALTTLGNLFLKDLAEVLLTGRKVDFSSHALIIDQETPVVNDGSSKPIKIDMSSEAHVRPVDEYVYILNTIGLESMIYVVYVLDRMTSCCRRA